MHNEVTVIDDTARIDERAPPVMLSSPPHPTGQQMNTAKNVSAGGRQSRVLGLLALSAISISMVRRAEAAPTVVKCIGEQTTKTTEMSPNWPAQMQTDLGATYTITNDGDGGGTVVAGSKGGTHTFRTATNMPYKDSLMSPDIVVIGPWAEHDEIAVEAGADASHFQADYDALVMDYLSLAKKPCVIVTTSVVIPTYQRNPATDMLVTNTIEPAVLAVAKAHNLPVVDLYTPFMGQAAWLGVDGHFTAAGAVQAAKLVEAALPMCTGGGGNPGTDAGSGAGGAAGSTGAGGSPGTGGSGGGSVEMGGQGGAGGEPASMGTGGEPATTVGGGGTTTSTSSGAAGSSTSDNAAPASTDAGGCSCSLVANRSNWKASALASLGALFAMVRLGHPRRNPRRRRD
jgi:hypothetical protein